MLRYRLPLILPRSCGHLEELYYYSVKVQKTLASIQESLLHVQQHGGRDFFFGKVVMRMIVSVSRLLG